jgi:hypothetical protein
MPRPPKPAPRTCSFTTNTIRTESICGMAEPIPSHATGEACRFSRRLREILMIYHGGCHCGRVRFTVEAPENLEVEDCNCSICTMTGFLHLIVPQSKFKLLTGQDAITTYRFNSGTAHHTFCRFCGIKSFYIPRSNPDGVDVNVRCLQEKPASLTVTPFDGRNWETNAHTLSHKSRNR